jgi:hypothetical protein
MLGVSLIDLVTKKTYLLMIYLCGVVYLLLRNPNRIINSKGIASPVSGTVSKVYRSRAENHPVLCIEITTTPLIDAQSFRLIPGEMPGSIKQEEHGQIAVYQSGIVVQHFPRWNLFQRIAGDFTQLLGSSAAYGYSLFGACTQITMPSEFEEAVVEGQRVIDSETIVAVKEEMCSV